MFSFYKVGLCSNLITITETILSVSKLKSYYGANLKIFPLRSEDELEQFSFPL